MKTPENGLDLGVLVASVCKSAKIDMIDGLPAMPVSGDVGNGFLCVPGTLDDLSWIAGVSEASRPFVLSAALRAAMQRGQAALKAYDKKNKDAATDDRKNAAQTAFATSLSGTEIQFNESNVITTEALRRFKAELFPQVSASRPGQVTDDAFMDSVMSDLSKNRKESYDKKMATLSDAVKAERTYEVSRKGQTDGPKIETGALQF